LQYTDITFFNNQRVTFLFRHKLINHIFTNKKYDILTKKYLIYDEHIGETMEQNHAPLDKNVIVCSESENECALVDLSILV
jgi:hypothetical protein